MSLDLDAIEARAQYGDSKGQTYLDLKALVAEVRQLHAEQRLDGKLIMSWADKKSHLARRLQRLRREVRAQIDWEIGEGSRGETRDPLRDILSADDAIAKRFRKKQAVRR